jgi:MFS family permease
MPFYYGWVIALSGALNASFVLGSAQFALSTFLVPMEEELEWSRTVFFGALSTRYLLAGMLGPLVGPWADGVRAPRIVLPFGVLMLGGSLSAVRWIDNPVMFFAVYGVVGAMATSLLNLQIWEAIILKWFSRRRTHALVVASIGEASGPMFFPLLITLFIALFGWRDAWLWYGVLTIALLLPLTLAVRTRPEHVGQHLDGDDAPVEQQADGARPAIRSETSFTRSEALRTRSFWLLATGFMMSGLAITGFQSQWIPHFRDIGFSAGAAAAAVSVYGAGNIASRVLWGTLAIRFSLQKLMTVHAVAAGLGVAFLIIAVDSEFTLFVWAVYQGLVLGSFFSLHTLLSAEYFGRPHIGAIRGVMMPPSSVSRAAGPLVLGALRDWRGNYDLAFVVVLAGWGVMMSLLAVSRRPRHPARVS